MTKAKKWFLLLSASFEFTNVNFNELYLLGFSLKLSELHLAGNLRKSYFTWIELETCWIYRLGDIGQKVWHVLVGIVSAAYGKWLQLTYYVVI